MLGYVKFVVSTSKLLALKTHFGNDIVIGTAVLGSYEYYDYTIDLGTYTISETDKNEASKCKTFKIDTDSILGIDPPICKVHIFAKIVKDTRGLVSGGTKT